MIHQESKPAQTALNRGTFLPVAPHEKFSDPALTAGAF